MTTKQVTVRCPQGLHLRVASQVAKIVQGSGTEVRVSCEGCTQADACSVLQLLMLGATVGTRLEINAKGPAESHVLQALTDVFEHGGGI